ncbi:MAG: hypothetical protein WDA71_02460 [Actinomycetota bacterium]
MDTSELAGKAMRRSTLILVVPALLAGGLLRGGPGLVGAASGLVLGIGFFAVSGWLIAWGARRSPEAMTAATLGGFVVKLAVVGAVLFALRHARALDHLTFACAALAGAALFLLQAVSLVRHTPYIPAPAGKE